MVFQVPLQDWLTLKMDRAWLEEQVAWKDFGNGVRIGKLARDGATGLVLYHVAADAAADAFQPHTHTGGEMYVVLQGEVYDDDGVYPEGSLVWMQPQSRHTPRCRGETWILTLWPGGVEA